MCCLMKEWGLLSFNSSSEAWVASWEGNLWGIAALGCVRVWEGGACLGKLDGIQDPFQLGLWIFVLGKERECWLGSDILSSCTTKGAGLSVSQRVTRFINLNYWFPNGFSSSSLPRLQIFSAVYIFNLVWLWAFNTPSSFAFKMRRYAAVTNLCFIFIKHFRSTFVNFSQWLHVRIT